MNRLHSFRPNCGTLALFGLPFGLSVLLSEKLLPTAVSLGVGALLLGTAVLCLILRKKAFRQTIAVLGLAVGLLWSGAYHALYLSPLLARSGETVTFSGIVTTAPEEASSSYRIEVSASKLGTVRIYSDNASGCKPGTVLTVTGELTAAPDTGLASGIHFYVYDAECTVTGNSRSPVTWPGRISSMLGSAAGKLFSGDVRGLYRALLTGSKSDLSSSANTALSRCGLSHIVAVSGLHMSILAGCFLIFIRNRRLRLLCIPFLLVFAALVGSPSAWRAMLMQSLILLAPLFRRESDPLTSLSFALIILLLANPVSVLSLSLQLSFLSILGIFLLTPRINDALVNGAPFLSVLPKWGGALYRVFCAAVSVSVGACAATVPVTILQFGELSLITIPANLLVVWLMTPALALAIPAAILVLIFPAGSAVFAFLPSLVGRLILFLVKSLASLPFSAIGTDSFYAEVWLIYAVLIGIVSLTSERMRKHVWIPILTVLAVLALAVGLNTLSLTDTALTAEVLNVGEGQSLLFLSGGEAAAVDCGGNSYDSAGDILADAVQEAGLNSLDTLIFTHTDTDHVGGIEELFARISVGRVCLPYASEPDDNERMIRSLCEEYGCTVDTITNFSSFSFGSSSLTVYPGDPESDGNNGSLSVLCRNGDFTFLATGDLARKGEKYLTENYTLPIVDVLIAGHHGSATSTSEELLDAVDPQVSVISVGKNSYGHPTFETLLRLTDHRTAVYRTDLNGTVTIRVPK